MSSRGSKSAIFIEKNRDPNFKKGSDLVSKEKLIQLETAFNRWKKKPWSVNREKALGKLSQDIKKAKHHLTGISKYSTLNRFGQKN
jgi:hypothetical protein